MSQNYNYPSTSSSVSIPAIGTNGSNIPGSSILIAGDNPTGKLTPVQVDASGNIITVPGAGSLQNVNITEVGGAALSLGQQLAAASLPVVLTAAQLATLTPLSTVAVTQSTSPWVDNITQIGGSAISLGQKLSAASMPVVLASDQSSITISGTVTANQGTSPWVENISQFGGSAVSLGSKVSASSMPVVIASDQGAVPVSQSGAPWAENITQIGGSALSLGSKVSASSIPVVIASDQGAVAISGTVAVSNFPATQPVSGTVAATQSGNWSVRTQDGSGNNLTSHAVNSNRGADQFTLGFVNSEFARNDYTSTNVTTSAWVQLIASTANEYQEIEIFDSSGQTLKIGFGGSGSEVAQFIVYPGGNGRIKKNVPAGTRISIEAISATANAGEIDINLYG